MGARRNPSRRQVVKGLGAVVVGAAVGDAAGPRASHGAGAEDAKPQAADRRRAAPALEVPHVGAMRLGGPLGRRAEDNLRHWLLAADLANPAMLQMFRDRDRKPPRDLVPWAGEFAGKYLISAVQALRLCRGGPAEPALREHLARFVSELVSTQSPDGYLGPFPTSEGMTGKGRWDLWGQYHCMLGLLTWFKETGDPAALASCRRCADLFCRTFLDGTQRVVQAGSEEMNESSSHVFALLYQQTGEKRYLDLLRHIEQDWQTPPSGDYVRSALAGKAFYQCPKPRWESLHSVQAIAELYFITGAQKYRDAFERIWWSIVEGDRHNTGGFSSGETATGNPYDPRPIETCCTIAWTAVIRDMLRMTGDSRAADELELSTWNAVLGAQHPSGRWWTYNTPMDGERKASAHEIVFQARAGSPELNCCSVNGPRGIGVLSEWAVMAAPEGLAVNYYGPCSVTVRDERCGTITIEQETQYPFGPDGRVTLKVTPGRPARFNLRLRIPGWSTTTSVRVNAKPVEGVRPGTYLSLERDWRAGDTIELTLDLSLRAWAGEREAAGKVSLYRGPILLAYDPRLDRFAPAELPAIDWRGASEILPPEESKAPPAPMLLLKCKAAGGATVTLCDFASAGAAGNAYRSWLPGEGKPVPFSRDNPWRLAR